MDTKKTGTVLRTVCNRIICAICLWVFSAVGWITFTSKMPLWEVFLIIVMLAWAIEKILSWVYALFVLTTCFLGCALMPVYLIIEGWLVLYVMSSVTGLFTIATPFFWGGLLMSIVFGWFRIPPPKDKSTEVSLNEEERSDTQNDDITKDL